MRGRAAVVFLVVAVLGIVSGCGTSRPHSTSTARSAPPSTIDTAIKVYGDCTTPSVEPAQIVLACVDEGELMVGLRWESWTASKAVGVGTFRYNDCSPDCANGHFHDVPGLTFVLSAPVTRPGGLLVWSEMRAMPALPNGFPTVEPLPTNPV